jgi:hypothetical protein
MRWHTADNEQLEIIFNHEFDLPNHLLVGLVEEMMTRKLFDGMIINLANKLMGHYNRDEVLQTGYLAVFQLARIFKTNKLSFKTMCFIAIERRLKTIIAVKLQKKNFMNEQALVNEVPVMVDTMNVERTVIRKLMLQEQLSKLSNKQLDIITRFLDGYSLAWIGANIYNQDTSAIRYQFLKALKNMGVEGFEIGRGGNLKGA